MSVYRTIGPLVIYPEYRFSRVAAQLIIQLTLFKMFQGGINDLEEDTIAHLEETNTSSDTSDITGLDLTQTEFADAFGMRPNSTFVEHMFLLVDENRSGHVSFREFLKIFILLSSGKSVTRITLDYILILNCFTFNANARQYLSLYLGVEGLETSDF